MLVWDFNLRHLHAIVKIAELGTMNAAARKVHLTQPAITQALSRTEALLGAPLFERRHDGMVPTEAADLFVPRARAALELVGSPHVTMSRMRALIALADSGSYSGASMLTGLSAPSLHRAVTDLSLASRRTLVQRRGKIVTLTESGKAMARAFRLARVELVAGLAEIATLKGQEISQIVVGAMPLSRARVLPAAIARFLRRRPKVRLSIVEGSRAELVEPLRNGMIDLMIGAMRDPLLEPDLVQHPLFRDRLVAVGRPGHPLAGARPTLAELARFPWVVAQAGAPLRLIWEKVFADAGVDLPDVPVESGSVMTIRQLLIESDYLTLLSPDQVAVEIEAGWLVEIAGLPENLDRPIGLTWRSAWRPTAIQAELIEELKRV